MHIPSMISDLAIMLLTAAVVGIIFKKLKLPTILGYLLAGFLISPYFPLFFNVEDTDAIETWSEIGVVVILFHIGLEFNLHKIAKVGSTAMVTAAIKMSGVMAVGFLFGTLIGLSTINSVFLGAMLSISSTVVIKKCFEELGVTHEKYTGLVIGTLIMEDIFSVFMMVILSAASAHKAAGGEALPISLLMMGLYLVIWLILGVFLIPTILNRVKSSLSDEMLVVLSLGTCFGMAVLGSRLGFSVELGAFLAGSLFAGTVHVERIERLTSGVKDMFAAVFFLSVGMLVDPNVIATRWTSIIPIVIIAVIAKLVFAPLGMILSGQSLGTAVKSGFSLAPIGEFSFIIAALGISLGVMDSYLYPVIVSASVITTLITPILIRHSGGATEFLQNHLPEGLLEKMKRYSYDRQQDEETNPDWQDYMKKFFRRILIYGSIMLIMAVAGVRLIEPSLSGIMPEFWAKIISLFLVYLIIVIFTRPMLNLRSVSFTHLWLSRRANRPPLVILSIIKIIIIVLIAFYPIHEFFNVHQGLLLIAMVIAVVVAAKTNIVSTLYLEMETRFLRNLNERIIEKEEKESGKQEWLDEDISIISFIVPPGADYVGQELSSLNWKMFYHVLVVKVERGTKTYMLPQADFKMQEGDKVYVVGEYQALKNLYKVIGVKQLKKIRTLKEFMEADYEDTENALACLAIKVTGEEPYSGKTIQQTQILRKGKCLVLGLQKYGYSVIMPDARMMINKGDIIWIMGSNNHVGAMAALSTQEE